MDAQDRQIKELHDRLQTITKRLDIDEKQRQIRQLEAQAAKPTFWHDTVMASQTMKELAALQQELTTVEELNKAIGDARGLVSLLDDEGEESAGFKADIERDIAKIAKDLNELEVKLFLSGPYDSSDVILSLHAGQGGTEAMDWAAMLFRMYSRYVESKRWKAELIDETPGEEAGLKSVTLAVSGSFAYGYLKGEAGTHRLVRQSPFNADHLRQTSFALVEVLPQIADNTAVEIRPEEIEFEAFRSGGHGGQNVNKVSTAVRLKHLPTGIVVTSQSQRYQAQNRANAMKLLKAKLWLLQQEKTREEKREMKGEHKIAGWGNQIRSYVLHPYHLVKDLRTGCETSDTQRVLDGDLEDFIQAEIRQLSW